MSCVSTRISLQWIPEPPHEYTDTLVLTTKGLHFVDIRIKTPLPVDAKGTDANIDWVITGVEHPIEGTSKVEFRHDINSHLKLNHGEAYDVGDFKEIENGDRSETGTMENWNTGVMQKYEEIWRTIDPLASKPDDYVRDVNENSASAPCIAYHLDQDGFLGKCVRIGNFAQGALLNHSTNKVSCVRWFKSENDWCVVFESGDEVTKIPRGEDKEGEVVEVEGLKWKVVESTF